VIPAIRFKDNVQLDANSYSIRIKGEQVAEGALVCDRFLAINSGAASEEMAGIQTKEPAFGLPAVWIEESQKDAAQLGGYTVIDPASVLMTHLGEVVKSHAYEVLSREDTQALVDGLKERCPTVVNELIPNVMTLGGVQKVLRNLLRENVPVSDLATILESLSDHAPNCKDINLLTEFARQALGRTICAQHQDPEGKLHAISLDPAFEQQIARVVEQTSGKSAIALEPAQAERFFQELPKALQKAMATGYDAVLLTSAAVRRHVRSLTERILPTLPVISYDEIDSGTQVEVSGMVSLPAVEAEA